MVFKLHHNNPSGTKTHSGGRSLGAERSPRCPCPNGQRDRLGEYSTFRRSLPADPRGLLRTGPIQVSESGLNIDRRGK